MLSMQPHLPKISCLCITNNRVALLQKSIALFKAQGYPHKEMVVVYLSTDISTRHFLRWVSDHEVKAVEVPYEDTLSLGDLRNISIAEASGEYICTWDDDDWFHPDRLRAQYESIVQAGKWANVLLNMVMLDNTCTQAYLSSQWLWEPSMMCSKQFIVDNDLVYPSINKREDTYFLGKLKAQDVIAPLQDPKLYIYCYTGHNTCSAEHFKKLFSLAQPLTVENSELVSRLYNQVEPDQVTLAAFDRVDWRRV